VIDAPARIAAATIAASVSIASRLPRFTGSFYMQLNAIWALRRQRNGYRHQLLGQNIDRTVFERLFVKSRSSFQVRFHRAFSVE
jgi:hypothetical protein